MLRRGTYPVSWGDTGRGQAQPCRVHPRHVELGGVGCSWTRVPLCPSKVAIDSHLLCFQSYWTRRSRCPRPLRSQSWTRRSIR